MAGVFDLYLACFTQQEIAERLDISQQTVSAALPDSATLPNPVKLQAEHSVDFNVPIYNVWKEQKNKIGAEHFGNTHMRCSPRARWCQLGFTVNPSFQFHRLPTVAHLHFTKHLTQEALYPQARLGDLLGFACTITGAMAGAVVFALLIVVVEHYRARNNARLRYAGCFAPWRLCP